MPILRRFQKTAEIKIGRKKSGRFKLYITGRVRNGRPTDRYWVEAGSRARKRNPLTEFATQNNLGYVTEKEVRDFAYQLFPREEKFFAFLDYDFWVDTMENFPADELPGTLNPWQFSDKPD